MIRAVKIHVFMVLSSFNACIDARLSQVRFWETVVGACPT